MTAFTLAFVLICLGLSIIGAYALAQEIVAMTKTDWPQPGEPDYWERRWKQICDVEHQRHGNVEPQ